MRLPIPTSRALVDSLPLRVLLPCAVLLTAVFLCLVLGVAAWLSSRAPLLAACVALCANAAPFATASVFLARPTGSDVVLARRSTSFPLPE